MDVQAFIRKWNTMSGRAHSISSKRATSLKLLLEACPRESLMAILSHVEDRSVSLVCFRASTLTPGPLQANHDLPKVNRTSPWMDGLKLQPKLLHWGPGPGSDKNFQGVAAGMQAHNVDPAKLAQIHI